MANLLEKAYVNSVQKYPLIVMVVLGICMGGLGAQISNLRFDASADSLIIEGDSALTLYRDESKRYNAEDFLVVTYTPTKNQNLYSQPVLDRIAQLQAELAALQPVSSVNSILNVPLLYSPKVPLTDLSESMRYLSEPTTDRALAAKEFLNSPIYKGLLTSPDAKTTVLQVNLKRQQELSAARELRDSLRARKRQGDLDAQGQVQLKQAEQHYEQQVEKYSAIDKQLIVDARNILDEYRDNAQLFLGGLTMVTNDMLSFIKKDLYTFGTVIFVFIIFVLGVVFREFRWVMLPMIACVTCVVLTTGLMAIFDWNLTVISANFVALLLILTLSIAVYLVVRYRELEIEEPQASKQQRVYDTVKFMLLPCLYTTLTTVVAFASLMVSGIRPVIDFGWMMTLGVIIALVVSFIVLPAGILLWGEKKVPELDSAFAQSPPFTAAIANFSERFSNHIIITSLLLIVLSVYGITLLKVDNRFIDYFGKNTEIYKGMETIDAELGGVIPFDILLRKKSQAIDTAAVANDDFADVDTVNVSTEDAAQDDFADVGEVKSQLGSTYWFTQAGLDEVKKVHNFIDGLNETGKTLSLATLYQVVEDILGSRVDDVQLALLRNRVEGQIKEVLVDPYLDSANNETRITVRVKETSKTLNRNDLIKQVDQFLSEEMGYSKDEYDLSGLLILYNNMLQSLFKSQILTLGAVFIVILLMFVIVFRSLSVALLAITPNLMAAGLVMGIMGLLAIPLDMMTITIASITVGIGVDNAIQYIYRFKNELPKDNDYLATMHRSHRSIGRAIFYTSITIIAGFSILVLSNFTPSIYFGFLTAFAMSVALLGNLLLLPQLLIKFKPFK